ncbi:MAG: hypothetical protein JJE46_07295 [Acidimicrobiia bacterium]|nr:hypothetical protein [Acidimicrobiia bacterium]
MIDQVIHSGCYTYEFSRTEYRRIQLIRVAEILAGNRLDRAAFFPAYTQAKRLIDPGEPLMVGFEEARSGDLSGSLLAPQRSPTSTP